MPKRQFDFSPSVDLILANLPTIRKVQKVLDEGVVTADVKRYLKDVAVILQEAWPKLRTWKSQISDLQLYFYPSNDWRVVTDDSIALCFSMYQCIEPSFYNDEDDPFVGLYVPNWKHRRNFAGHLKSLRITGFQHISEEQGIDSDDDIPLWSTVHLAPLVQHSRVNMDLLQEAIVDRFRKLVAAEAKITRLISLVRRKRA